MKNIDLDVLKEFKNRVKDIADKFEKDVPEKYIDWLTEIWSEAEDEIELEEKLNEKEQQEEQPSYYNSYDEYIREVR